MRGREMVYALIMSVLSPSFGRAFPKVHKAVRTRIGTSTARDMWRRHSSLNIAIGSALPTYVILHSDACRKLYVVDGRRGVSSQLPAPSEAWQRAGRDTVTPTWRRN